LKVPTINLELADVPPSLMHGIYACSAVIGGKTYKSAVHYGPRPVFKDSESFEVHILDAAIPDPPETLELTVVARLRDVENFPDAEALKAAIADDIAAVRAILGS
jgi:FAD synthase